MINEVTCVVITKGKENCQALGNLHKSNQDNNAFSTQHTNNERSQQQQKRYKAGGEAEKENIHPETNEPTNQNNIEEVVDSLTSEESTNVFLARQRLRFVKENLNKQEMKDSIFLELNIAAHNIDGIASVPSIQKLHNLLEFINENSIDIIAISETNIDYRQEYYINQDIKSKVYSIIFSECDQKTKRSGTALVIHNRWMKHHYSIVWSIYAAPNDQDMRKSLIDELKMAMEGHNRSVHNTIILHIVLGDFNDTINNKIDRSPSTRQPGSQFLIQLSQLGLYDMCRVLYLDAELFTHEKWDKNKNRSAPISKSRIDQIWITYEPDVIPVEFLLHSLQMVTNSHHSIISTTLNISGFIRNNFRHCVPDQLQDPDLHQDKRIVDISKITNVQWKNFTETLDREIESWDFQQLIEGINYEIQLGDEKSTDGEEIKRRFNELWNNIISAISIVMNIELPMKLVKYPGSHNTRHKLTFADKTM
ncbi:11725_t:CDS:2 [Rhizophagus irregularis]|nr:11725_t:CDS:2 [Rhizophagus irregularis]